MTSTNFTLPTIEWQGCCSSTTDALRPSYSGRIVRRNSSGGRGGAIGCSASGCGPSQPPPTVCAASPSQPPAHPTPRRHLAPEARSL
eukprot:scaffold164271_cov20-Tisochrysis_lutea.AAC.1